MSLKEGRVNNWLIDNNIGYLQSFLIPMSFSLDAPSVTRPTLVPTIVRHRGVARVVARCQFRITNRKNRRTVSVVQFFVNNRLTRTVSVKWFHADLVEQTFGFKAGVTVRVWMFSGHSSSHCFVPSRNAFLPTNRRLFRSLVSSNTFISIFFQYSQLWVFNW